MPRPEDLKRFFSPEYLAQHPEFGGSLIPVWGSGRETGAFSPGSFVARFRAAKDETKQ